MPVERTATTLTVRFAPHRTERFTFGVLAFVAFFLVVIGVRVSLLQHPTELHCERDRDVCQLRGDDIMGRAWSWAMPLGRLRRSAVVEAKYHEVRWVVVNDEGRELELGSPTGRAVQAAEYRRLAPLLDGFLADPGQKVFDATFESIGGPPTAVFVVAGLLMVVWLVRWLDGWRTRLDFDAAAGTLTVRRSPRLLPGRRVFPLDEVAEAEIRDGFVFLVWSVVPTLTLRLRTAAGRRLFGRRQIADKATLEELRADLEAIRAFLAERRAA
jgi:hypothetical protein